MRVTKRTCPYCGVDSAEGISLCGECGAPLEDNSLRDYDKGEPFFFNGYIVYSLFDYVIRNYEFVFYLGTTLIERIVLSEDVIRKFVPLGQTYMPMIWDLFLVTQKKKGNTILSETYGEFREDGKLCRFKVELIQTPEDKYWASLNWSDFREAYYEVVR